MPIARLFVAALLLGLAGLAAAQDTTFFRIGTGGIGGT